MATPQCGHMKSGVMISEDTDESFLDITDIEVYVLVVCPQESIHLCLTLTQG